MKIGIPKELSINENRVGITPPGVRMLTTLGHQVIIESGAGEGSGISNSDFIQAGALISDVNEVWTSDLILKVKEPLPEEYGFIKEHQRICAFLHLANNEQLTYYLTQKKATAISYDSMQKEDGSLPILQPMSEVAGRLAVLQAANFLQKQFGGNGQLLGGISGVESGQVVIIGAGTVGKSAVRVATALGAKVTVLDTNLDKLRALDDLYQGRIETIASNQYNITRAIRTADVVISAVLKIGEKSPMVITESMVKSMKKGSVIMDVSIDQGASVETIKYMSNYDEPIFKKYDVLHYAVTNIPGATPHTSTYALANATLPYIVEIAENGVRQSVLQNYVLHTGVVIHEGKIRDR